MTEEEMLAARNAWYGGDGPEAVDPVVEQFLPLVGYLTRRMSGSVVSDDDIVPESLAAILWAIRDSGTYPQFTLDVQVRYALAAAGFSLLREAHPEWTQGDALAAERDFMAMNLVPGGNPAAEPAPPTLVTGWRETALARIEELTPLGGLGRGLRRNGPSVSSRLERLAAITS